MESPNPDLMVRAVEVAAVVEKIFEHRKSVDAAAAVAFRLKHYTALLAKHDRVRVFAVNVPEPDSQSEQFGRFDETLDVVLPPVVFGDRGAESLLSAAVVFLLGDLAEALIPVVQNSALFENFVMRMREEAAESAASEVVGEAVNQPGPANHPHPDHAGHPHAG